MITPSKPAHFLLVEDNEEHAELIRMAFDENQVVNTLDHVVDGELAIEYLRGEGAYENRCLPDVILLDIKLPKIDGHGVLEFIKSDEALQMIPVVILTTSAAEVDVVNAYKGRVNSYITKPMDFDQFHNMAKELNLYWAVYNLPAVIK